MNRQPVNEKWSVRICDSLEKVFPDLEPRTFNEQLPVIVFPGEWGSFQLAFRPPTVPAGISVGSIRIELDAVSGIKANVSTVELVPVELPAFEGHDDDYLRTAPGLFPDLLVPTVSGEVQAVAGQWRAAWVDIEAEKGATAVNTHIGLRVYVVSSGDLIAQLNVPVRIASRPLPQLKIANTQWFHCDGIADYYDYQVFSEDHWSAIDNFMYSASRISVNTILTPVWTPPLDTAIGSTRTATQLVGIKVGPDGEYDFDFTLLRRWMELCRKNHIHTLEIPHFFTQWGAKYTPAIYVQTETGEEQRFGWHVKATDPRYRSFLEVFVPSLLEVLREEWGLERVVFHISDEPTAGQLSDYDRARVLVADLLDGCTIIDAISDFELYDAGAVPLPVVTTDHADKFLRANVQLWLYYCGVQNKYVGNRSIAQPSSRNRVLGTQLFLTGALGFLHWGFNFYNSYNSAYGIDPFKDTCAGKGFPGGDSFLVYPGASGHPLNSIRYMVFGEAINDYRAMQLLAALQGRMAVRKIVDRGSEMTLTEYPHDPDHYRRALCEIVDAIENGQNEHSIVK